jgi:hypothetical protein
MACLLDFGSVVRFLLKNADYNPRFQGLAGLSIADGG